MHSWYAVVGLSTTSASNNLGQKQTTNWLRSRCLGWTIAAAESAPPHCRRRARHLRGRQHLVTGVQIIAISSAVTLTFPHAGTVEDQQQKKRYIDVPYNYLITALCIKHHRYYPLQRPVPTRPPQFFAGTNPFRTHSSCSYTL